MAELENKRDFVHLHLHTEYSLLDGSGKIRKLVDRASELGMKALAITDHGTMYGVVDFYKACKEKGIKPIIGCEIYTCSGDMDNKTLSGNSIHHLVLLCKNETGYQNLMKIVSEGSIRGFYYKPRVDHEFLKDHSEGLICLSACLGGEVQENLNHGRYEEAEKAAIFYRDTFKEGFYLELQDHGINEQQKVNVLNIELARKLGIPLICTNDVHYIRKEDYKSHDILLCVQTVSSVDEADRMRYPSHEFYLKSADEMYELFQEVPEALENTVRVAEQCRFDFEFHVSRLPIFPLPEGTDHAQYLRDRAYEGLFQKYREFRGIKEELESGAITLKTAIDRAVSSEAEEMKEKVERLEYELNIIKTMGYVDYFLIVWDFIKYANDHDIPTGVGRGSGAASIVAYSLNITKIEPLKYDLIFERFLNPERISMPDIDSDFCYERRQDVIDYVVEKYGKNNVAQIITFGTMAAKACIRDVGRAMNYPYGEVDQIAKMIPTKLGVTIDSALEESAELRNLYESDQRVKELIDVARDLEGLPRHSSTHAAGVVITQRELSEYVPLQKNDEAIVTQYPMGTLEELGLLKMDFLGLRTLTAMRDAVDMIRENRGEEVDIDALDFSDPKVYQMIGEGHTVGVFQLESTGMTSFMKELKPESLEDIIAGISLYRPGPMGQIPKYIEGKRNRNSVTYITPELEPILDVTYGVMVYQEQVMRIVRELAGYSLGRADLVRRAMSKKKHDVMLKERQNFIEGLLDEEGNIVVPGTRRNGIADDKANEIFDLMTDFASYAFNKAHAAAYAVIGYQTAYLMRYYPVETIAALLNTYISTPGKYSFYIRYAKSRGIDILPPDLNESYEKFTVKGNSIRFGLGGIKNLGTNAIRAIIRERQKGRFRSLKDFIDRCDSQALNKRGVESMIKAGVFDSMDVYRSRLLAVYERLLDNASSERKRSIKGQVSFFQMMDDSEEYTETFPELDDFDLREKLTMEREMTGLYISGHPLDEYRKNMEEFGTITVSDLIYSDMEEDDTLTMDKEMDGPKLKDGMGVFFGGLVVGIKTTITRSNSLMAFMQVEDFTGIAEVIVFPNVYEKVSHLLTQDSIIAIRGRVQIRDDENATIIAEEIVELQPGTPPPFKMSLQERKRYLKSFMEKAPGLSSRARESVDKNMERMNGGEKKTSSKKAYLQFDNLKENPKPFNEIKGFLRVKHGNVPVYVYDRSIRKVFLLDRMFWIEDSEEFFDFLRLKMGEENFRTVVEEGNTTGIS